MSVYWLRPCGRGFAVAVTQARDADVRATRRDRAEASAATKSNMPWYAN